jgi:phosphate-selective porin OprO/OprP
MLHFGANFQHREFQANNCPTPTTCVTSSSTGAPSTNQLGRYRARPFLQTTDVRFVDTSAFAAKSDQILGAEVAGIFKSLHFTGEAQLVKVNAYSAGDTQTGLNAFPGTTAAPNTALVPSDDPSFFSWYAELGYYLTGETRGYKNGMWDRTKVLKPFSQGGWGAFQVNARYDYLDLATDDLKEGFTNNFTTGVATASNNYGRGGTQTGYLASLIWIPEDYMRFLLQFAHTRVEGGPLAGTVNPTSTDPLDERNYSSNSVALRAQVDF